MTISYQLDVSRASAIAFLKLLFRWRASLWKIVLKELIMWCLAYAIIAFIYQSPYILTAEQKDNFAKLADYLDSYLRFEVLTFILAFYVSIIIMRWTTIIQNMGYIESESLLISNYVDGDDDETRMMRRAMVRYLCLAQVLVFRDISVPVRKRFPTYESIVKAGFMTEKEKDKLLGIKLDYDKYWVPINWTFTLLHDARRAKKISSDVMTNKVCDELRAYRQNLQVLSNFDWVPIPLVYPQVIMIAVYGYFSACLISRQFIDTANDGTFLDLHVPIMTIVQFIFYVGWCKAAAVLLNPMGEDDDDFECNYLIDKNLATGLSIVDDSKRFTPTVQPDQFLLKGHVDAMYSQCSAEDEIHPLIGSAVRAKLPEKTGKPLPVNQRKAKSVFYNRSPHPFALHHALKRNNSAPSIQKRRFSSKRNTLAPPPGPLDEPLPPPLNEALPPPLDEALPPEPLDESVPSSLDEAVPPQPHEVVSPPSHEAIPPHGESPSPPNVVSLHPAHDELPPTAEDLRDWFLKNYQKDEEDE